MLETVLVIVFPTVRCTGLEARSLDVGVPEIPEGRKAPDRTSLLDTRKKKTTTPIQMRTARRARTRTSRIGPPARASTMIVLNPTGGGSVSQNGGLDEALARVEKLELEAQEGPTMADTKVSASTEHTMAGPQGVRCEAEGAGGTVSLKSNGESLKDFELLSF